MGVLIMEKNEQLLQGLVESLSGITGTNKQNVKIFKSANNKSILDVTASLDFHKQNNKGENVYKGKVIFSITDIGKKNYLKAFVDKAKVKVLVQSIMDHTFNDKVFKGGFTDFGGTVSSDPSKIRSRILKISLSDRGQYVFNIDEGKGKVGDTGNIQMIGKPEMSVTRYIPYEEALQMAHEVYDYIRDQELAALLKGKPLFTLTTYEGNQSRETESSYSNTQTFSTDTPSTSSDSSTPYVIQGGPWKGKTFDTISNSDLLAILEKTKNPSNAAIKELHDKAIEEARKRKARANS